MHPEIQLAIVAGFAGFLLKTFLGFCICWAISKTVVSPRRKFLVWFAFISIAAGYWLWLLFSFIPHSSSALSFPLHAVQSPEPVAIWQMPASWSDPLLIAERVLGGIYLLALGNFLVLRIKKQLRLRWVLRFAYRAPDPIETLFRSIALHTRADKVRLLVLSGIYSPATFGWIHPVVLLPPLCLDQDEGELADIFRHELQHVARHDFFFNNVASLCRSLLFFHPAVWFAMRRMELESELACDLAVVHDSPERRATYAECLVRFARLHAAQDPTPWNLDFAGSSIQLKVRVRSVLKETAKLPAWLLGLRASLAALLLAAFLCAVPSLIRRAVICPSNCAADRSVIFEYSAYGAFSEEIATPGSRARELDAVAVQSTGITRRRLTLQSGSRLLWLRLRAGRVNPVLSHPGSLYPPCSNGAKAVTAELPSLRTPLSFSFPTHRQ